MVVVVVVSTQPFVVSMSQAQSHIYDGVCSVYQYHLALSEGLMGSRGTGTEVVLSESQGAIYFV